MQKKLCTLCPRNCKTDRDSGGKGFCGETSDLRIASACIHFGEEPPVTVNGGSGTIFVTGCILRCAFCQNYQISQCGTGSVVSPEEFADICLKLQAKNAENINKEVSRYEQSELRSKTNHVTAAGTYHRNL